jgi:hypothetical protein
MTRRILCALVLAVGLAATTSTARADYQEELEAELAAVKELVEAGVADDIIVKHVRASGFVFDLTADDILELRRAGVSDEVIEAMIDTALESDTPRERRTRAVPEPDDNVYVNLSAGWFSPWYHYPYAWGYYYDPFPAYYSFYYYPFRYAYHWGYYGYCSSYYYRSWCEPYRWWDHPHWFNDSYFHASCRVPVPHTVPGAETWQGSGLRNNRGRPRDVVPPAVSERRESTVVRRSVRDRLQAARVRVPDGARAPRQVSADAPRGRNGSSVDTPRRRSVGDSMQRRRPATAPNGRREAQAAPAPRTETPRVAPRSGSAPRTQPRSAVSSPRAPRSGVASAPRSGGVSTAPRGARGRMR